jgi:hypothetical protein
VPLLCDGREQKSETIFRGGNFARAIGTFAAVTSIVDYCLPFMSIQASPPGFLIRAGCNIIWREGFVSVRMPFPRKLCIDNCKTVLNGWISAGAKRAIASMTSTGYCGLPFVSMGAFPPDFSM